MTLYLPKPINLKQATDWNLVSNSDLFVIPTKNAKLIQNHTPPKHPLLKEVTHHLNTDDLTKKAGSSLLFYPQSKNSPKRVMLVELGSKPQKTELSTIKQLNNVVSISLLTVKLPNPTLLNIIWAIENFRPLKTSDLILYSNHNVNNKVFNKAQSLIESLNLIKFLGNKPANQLTPAIFADFVKVFAENNNLIFSAKTQAELYNEGFGALIGVGQGSEHPSQLVEIIANPEKKKTIALVGKGVTFDSGGISLKPSKDMHEMKFDMLGGAYVLALTFLAKKLDLPFKVVGIIGLAENLPGPKALKPGDVVKSYNKKTIEVLNTDAEGRLILADLLAYSQKAYNPNYIFDFATLTGSVIASLGPKICGCFTRTKGLESKLSESAKVFSEHFHFLPLHEGYLGELKSNVADLANIGKGRYDSILAALFLSSFVKPATPWIHFDIAGIAQDSNGPTGNGLRSIYSFLSQL